MAAAAGLEMLRPRTAWMIFLLPRSAASKTPLAKRAAGSRANEKNVGEGGGGVGDGGGGEGGGGANGAGGEGGCGGELHDINDQSLPPIASVVQRELEAKAASVAALLQSLMDVP